MINGLSVEEGEVWIEEVDLIDNEELIDDLMSIIEVIFDTFIGCSECENDMTRQLMYGVLCRRLVNEIEGSL
jgi:hypothetical protein